MLDEYGDAIEADLMNRGYDLWGELATRRLSWRKLQVWLTYAPRDSAFYVEYGGEDALWDLRDLLIGLAVDALNMANWQRAGGKGKRPKSIMPDGKKDTEQIGGGKVMSLDEARVWHNRRRAS